MVQTFAISQALESLSLVEDKFNLVESSDDTFFVEWYQNLPELSAAEKATLDRYKERFLAHRYRGNLSEGAVDRLLVSPLLDLAGLYEPNFSIDTEKSVEVVAEDDNTVYRGRIDALILEHQLWVLVVEEKASRVDMETAIPQCLAYMAGSPNLEKPVYGLVTNGHQFAFLKLQQRSQKEYRISDTFSLRSRQNHLYDVVQILKQIRDRL
ncbi:MAG TPA: restriction endonuclease subunit R [Cyanobacteria bacterium UBA12227]|nr:restriction endonuclease subunit R [Cyanobacteria bacterium UBA12227]HAX85652.1 restriction endonuclease subunit R [Cyanobacteria bacterium UBA11370]HBY81220.1 restriction endonuclease subunit R [Cyanobacteria bacterium UBA11148]